MWKLGRNFLHPFEKQFLSSTTTLKLQFAGMEYSHPKEGVNFRDWPEHRKLRHMAKQPTYTFKPPRLFKMIRLMRGPEPVHNELIYKGFGVKALLGGRMEYQHFEVIRNYVNGRINTNKMFAVWRVDEPWQPLAKRSTGRKLGGGKGPIHHYCTPVKANRIILELGGNIHKIEAQKILVTVAGLLPFPARFVSHEDLQYEKEQEKWVAENNLNPYDMEYIIRNNMGGCQKWLSKYDLNWLGKYK